MPALIPGKRRHEESIEVYLLRITKAGTARGGPYISHELALALLDTRRQVEELSARMRELEDRSSPSGHD